MVAYVYILKSVRNKYYVGSTTDLKNRIKHHEGGFTPSTKRLGKPYLVFSQKYKTLREARIVERRLKKLKRRDYIEKIIKNGFIKMTVDL